MIVEIYIEVNEGSGIYDKVDLYKDENIVLKYNIKDSADIGKIFSTYSQTFTIPMSDRNNQILNYPFNTDVTRSTIKYINCKIYVNKLLIKVGKVSVSAGTYKMKKGSSYTLQFFTNLKSLKDQVGSDLLNKMGATGSFDWTVDNVYDRIINGTNSTLLVPLISNKRVWSYDTAQNNDIKWVNSSATASKSVIIDELRPAIQFKYVMDSVINYYGLTVSCPLFDRSEYTNLYIYGTNNNLSTPNAPLDIIFATWSDYELWPYDYAGNMDVPGWDATSNTTTNEHTVTWVGGNSEVTFYGIFNVEVFATLTIPTTDLVTMKITYIDRRPASYGAVLATRTMEDRTPLDSSSAEFIDGLYFDLYSMPELNTDPLIFSIEVSSSTPMTWTTDYSISMNALSGDEPGQSFIYRKYNRYNTSGVSGLNYLSVIPEMKVIDFLTSFFKTFNIRVVESPTSNLLYWETPSDFIGVDKDFTPYTSIEDHSVEAQDIYDKYILTHKTPKYKSNVDYKTANVSNENSKEYGQLIYSTSNPILKTEYKVETQFCIIPPKVIGDTSVETFYGFDDTSPEASSTYTWAYKPNYNEMTLFYNNGSSRLYDINNMGITFSYRKAASAVSFATYSHFSLKDDPDINVYVNSLGFKDEVNVAPQFIYTKNLYTNYYLETIESLNDSNSHIFKYKMWLPSSEIISFDLRNKIIVSDKKYHIESADINIVTGESTLKLINLSRL